MFNNSMVFDLGDEVNALRDMVHGWAQERLKPMAAEIDRTNSFPAALWREMGELGLLGITVEEEYGGAAMASRWRRSPARAPRSASPTARIPISASIRSA